MSSNNRRKRLVNPRTALILLIGGLAILSLVHNIHFLSSNARKDDIIVVDAPFAIKKSAGIGSNPEKNQTTKATTAKTPSSTTSPVAKRYQLPVGVSFLNSTDLIFKARVDRINRFRPEYSPFMLNTTYHQHALKNSNINSSIEPVRIRVLLFEGPKISFRSGPTGKIGDEMLNICMDGFEKSPYFELVGVSSIPKNNQTFFLQEDDDIVWVVEMRLMEDERKITIPERTLQLAKNTRAYQMQQQQLLLVDNNKNNKDNNVTQNDATTTTNKTNHNHTTSLPLLRVVFMDYRDRVHNLCFRHKGKIRQELANYLGPQNVRAMNQQIVQNRAWDKSRNFTKPGHLYEVGFRCWEFFPLQAPYTVRSDYANHVLTNYQEYLPSNATATTTTTPTASCKKNRTAVDTVRPVDVAHFWTRQRRQGHCHLRDAVSDTILSLNNTVLPSLKDDKPVQQDTNRTIHFFADFISTSGRIGRTALQDAYIEALLTTKIVVVAQRDAWEDHYRFFEAMVGGGLVMTDPMITLPEGYINGTNLIVYGSLESLKRLIVYYLQHQEERLEIARRGWELALKSHRSYHWMENLFFGRRLTP